MKSHQCDMAKPSPKLNIIDMDRVTSHERFDLINKEHSLFGAGL